MLQVIDKEFEKLQDLVDHINEISIRYGYLKDYEMLMENGKYNLLLNFELPEVSQLLELAELKQEKDEGHLVYKTIYNIEVQYKSRDTYSSYIHFSDLLSGFIIHGSFGFKNYFDLITIIYDKEKDNFNIELRNFDYERSMGWWHTIVEDNLIVQVVDHEVVYNHLVKLIFYRGYLLSKSSLKELKNDLYYVCNWLNKKAFDRDK